MNLPEGGAICDLKSFKMHMDVATNSATVGGTTVYGRLPADAASLISRVEVYLNGVQLQQGAAEYNTICRMLKIGRSSRDKDGSTDRALSHGAISMSDATGLVQRRRAAPKDENNRESPESGERNEDDDAGMDHDSKETRLTLMEEVLLLGLKDKGRWVACR